MYHIIINPASRSGKGKAIWTEQVEPLLKQEKVSYQHYFSRKVGDVARMMSQITEEETQTPIHIIILGGDGTVNEALQGIKDPTQVILGYIPTGSSNDLARDLRIPKDPAAALDLILHTGTVHSMDMGELTYDTGDTRRFAVSCGIGFDAAVCQEALHSRIKDTLNRMGLGKLTYLGIALKQLFTARKVSCTLTLEDHPPIQIPRFLFVTCMSHRYEGGGFLFCPAARDNDGILDLCAVGDIAKAVVLFALPTAFFGKHYFFRGITPYQASCIKIETTAPLWVHTDGEVTRQSTGFTVNCRAGVLQMIAPAACGASLPGKTDES